MATNRVTFAAPTALMSMTKATLADLVWELAAHAASSVDDFEDRCRVIVERTAFVHAPRADVRVAQGVLDAVRRKLVP
jgi:hypothetical protein